MPEKKETSLNKLETFGSELSEMREVRITVLPCQTRLHGCRKGLGNEYSNRSKKEAGDRDNLLKIHTRAKAIPEIMQKKCSMLRYFYLPRNTTLENYLLHPRELISVRKTKEQFSREHHLIKNVKFTYEAKIFCLSNSLPRSLFQSTSVVVTVSLVSLSFPFFNSLTLSFSKPTANRQSRKEKD